MSEPFASFGDVDQLGLPSPLVALHARQEAREVAAERRAAEERAERAEARREAHLFGYLQRAVLEGREGVDPNDPSTFVPSVDEMAARVFDEQDREAARSEFRAKVDAGELHLLNVPASEMSAVPPSAEELADERAEAAATRARYRTQHAGLAAKIRRALRGKVTT